LPVSKHHTSISGIREQGEGRREKGEGRREKGAEEWDADTETGDL